jgi:hypothetical protein
MSPSPLMDVAMPGKAKPTNLFARVSDRANGSRGLVRPDARTKHGHVLRDTTKALTEHVGGNPSIAEKILIERASWLALECSMHDEKVARGTSTEYDGKRSLAASNQLQHIIGRLGLKPASRRPKRLSDIMGDK